MVLLSPRSRKPPRKPSQQTGTGSLSSKPPYIWCSPACVAVSAGITGKHRIKGIMRVQPRLNSSRWMDKGNGVELIYGRRNSYTTAAVEAIPHLSPPDLRPSRTGDFVPCFHKRYLGGFLTQSSWPFLLVFLPLSENSTKY